MKTKILTHNIKKDIGWVRFFGRGFYWKDLTKHSRSFSERNGYTKTIIRFDYLIGLLK